MSSTGFRRSRLRGRIRYAAPAFVTALMWVPVADAGAQPARVSARVASSPRPPLGGACASLMEGPSELTRTPEGLALLRFKRELEGVATVMSKAMTMPGQSSEQREMVIERMDVQRMTQVQRGVDSLMQVFVQYRTRDGKPGATVTVRRGDSTMVVDGKVVDSRALIESMDASIRAARPSIEVTLRALEPQIAAFSSAGARIVGNGSPPGYLGVSLSGSQVRLVSDSGIFTAHCDYPMIETVEVGSPARAAGLGAGDTILAYNGKDVVAQAVNYPQLLMPGKVVRIRVRREGKMRDVPVTVSGRAPDRADFGDHLRENVRVIGLAPAQRPSPPFGFWQSWSSSDGPSVRMTPALPSPAVVTGGANMMMLLGAQLNAVDDEFARTTGLEPGILITRVLPGTAAAEAGLRAGEIIRAVNGTPVRELSLIARTVNATNVRDVKLTVSRRDTSPRIVTLRW